MFQRQYRTIIKETLNVFTLQLEQQLTAYSELKAKAKQGEDIRAQIIPALEHIVTILEQLKYLYIEFPREPAKAEKMVERITKTLMSWHPMQNSRCQVDPLIAVDVRGIFYIID